MKRIVKALEVFVMLLLGNLYFLHLYWKVSFAGIIFVLVLACTYYVLMHIFPTYEKIDSVRINALSGGSTLLSVFMWSSVLNAIGYIGIFKATEGTLVGPFFWINLVLTLLLEVFLYCNGIIRVYIFSSQLGSTRRIIFLCIWWVPIVNLLYLYHIQRIVRAEISMECEKAELNAVRAESSICQTKYPILMVHGVFFRDMRFFNYWGRVPKELMKNGATIFYGEQQSAATVAESAEELKQKITEIIQTTGCEKVNIIAHSKGGLDSRYAISCLDMAPFVASLTTINTPHYGCAFADYLLSKIPKSICHMVADKYNRALRKLGDPNPDFMGAVMDLTVERTSILNQQAPDSQQVVYHSYGSKMRNFYSAPFPQCFTYFLSHYFSKDNDGLVDVRSAAWTKDFQLLQPKSRQGISHGDMIDLYRKNVKGFDVREFYVNVVKSLREEGL